ncbi:MAG: hypothetical protein ABIP68_08155 [Ferruginibacter sp.]
MKKITLAICLIAALGITKKASAQYYFYDNNYYDNPLLFEIGGSINAMNCLTDLGGKKGIGAKFIKDLNTGKTTLSGGLFLSAIYKNAVALRLEGTFGRLQANDNVLAGITDIAKERFNRNLNFRTNISEIALMAEFHPLYIFVDWMERDGDPPRTSPYLLAGVGYYSFNPQGNVDGRWIDLQPLSTEGQGFKEYSDRQVYKLKQMNVPLGIGVRYELSQFLALRGEFVYRKLFTDYLDDVSKTYVDPTLFYTYFSPDKADLASYMADRQIETRTNPAGGGKRGSPKQNDAYFTFNLKLSLTLGRERQ